VRDASKVEPREHAGGPAGLAATSLFGHIRLVPTTVHIPRPLLDRVDARAKHLGVSRNRVIVRAIEREVASAESWPAPLLALLRKPLSKGTRAEVDRMSREITRARRSRRVTSDIFGDG
jgi:hypothetical protein